ncbi:MAG: hypothetical protein M1820_000205 [Bogoriella megaspora]|nr:MAG: hypothetical protein M1820_000205 [Bogoriella megaspora]
MSDIVPSPQNTPLYPNYPRDYVSAYSREDGHEGEQYVQEAQVNWGYWEFASNDAKQAARYFNVYTPEDAMLEAFSSTTPNAFQKLAFDNMLFVWIPGMLDGAEGCHMGAPATAMEHLKEIDARRAWHGLPQIGRNDTTIVYTGSDFNWYLRPGANLEYVLEWINETSLTRASEFSLGPPTAGNIIAGFPQWRNRSLYSSDPATAANPDSVPRGMLPPTLLYLEAADRRLKPHMRLDYICPPPNGYIVGNVSDKYKDKTSFHPAQLTHAPDDLPQICYQLHPTDRDKAPCRPRTKDTKPWDHPPRLRGPDGSYLYDIDDEIPDREAIRSKNPHLFLRENRKGEKKLILDWPQLPFRIGRNETWWREESWFRIDARLTYGDVDARSFTTVGHEHVFEKGQKALLNLRIDTHARVQRRFRTRPKWYMRTWYNKAKTSEVSAAEKPVDEYLTTTQKLLNTTKGATPGWYQFPPTNPNANWQHIGQSNKQTFKTDVYDPVAQLRRNLNLDKNGEAAKAKAEKAKKRTHEEVEPEESVVDQGLPTKRLKLMAGDTSPLATIPRPMAQPKSQKGKMPTAQGAFLPSQADLFPSYASTTIGQAGSSLPSSFSLEGPPHYQPVTTPGGPTVMNTAQQYPWPVILQDVLYHHTVPGQGQGTSQTFTPVCQPQTQDDLEALFGFDSETQFPGGMGSNIDLGAYGGAGGNNVGGQAFGSALVGQNFAAGGSTMPPWIGNTGPTNEGTIHNNDDSGDDFDAAGTGSLSPTAFGSIDKVDLPDLSNDDTLDPNYQF